MCIYVLEYYNFIRHTWYIIYEPVAPVAYQVILESGIGQFREFESPRVHILLYIHGDFFLCTN